ncbi:MAG: hypothetical protein NC928_02835 [Candidatus Omnitrophica bacterium]|nr:hypothetical protein [Candidatus Omnitrophota bacterium]
MGDKLKWPGIILVVLLVLALSFSGGALFLLQKERKKSMDLQEELEDTQTRQKIAESKLQEAQNLISTLQIKLEEAKLKIDNLSRELGQEKSAKEEALAKIEQLKTDLEQQKDLRQNLEKKLTQAEKDVQVLQGQLREMESRKQELEAKLNTLEAQGQQQGVELGKIVVAPEGKIPEVKTEVSDKEKLEGKILVVNKDYNFVVINLGSKDRVALGDIFSVFHGHQYIGDVRIEKIHDSMSAAGFMSDEMKAKIVEGDRVLRKTK